YLQAEAGAIEALGSRDGSWFDEASRQVMNALHAHFKPEFLNRVDDIIIFSPLGKEQLVKIVDLRLEDVRRLLADRKISSRRSTIFTNRSEEHTSELQSRRDLVCSLLLEKKKKTRNR